MFPSPDSSRIPIIMPQLGESIAEATVISIAVNVGDEVTADQEIIEVETNKALLQVASPCTGQIVELTVVPKETYAVGAILGYIQGVVDESARRDVQPVTGLPGDPDEPAPMLNVEPGQPAPGRTSNGNGRHLSATDPASDDDAAADANDRTAPATLRPVVSISAGAGGGLPVPATLGGAGYLSPRVKARLSELGLHAADLSAVAGTGAGGRVTVADLEKFLAELEGQSPQPASNMRVAVADAMRRSWSRPLATIGRPVNLDRLLAHRKAAANPKPGIVLYAIRALALALAEDKSAASRLVGRRLIGAGSIDIGFAVEVEEGLMVPVLRAVDTTPMSSLNAQYHDLVAAARRRQLPPGTSGGAVASVTNFGTFGLTWATPIPLPDETLMLGLGAGSRVPAWDEDKAQFVPIIEAEVTLSFDHRALDGGSAGRLLARVVRHLAAPESL